MKNENKKVDCTIYLHPETNKMIDAHVGSGDFQNRSVMVEAAIKFYCGVLDPNANKDFLGNEIIKSIKAIANEMQGKIFSQLRTSNINLSILTSLYAVHLSNLNDKEIEYLRKDAAGFVDRMLRAKSFVQALKEERGDE